MKYVSTRGGGQPKNFDEAILTGLAPDGGLYVPTSIPSFSISDIEAWKKLSYKQLAFEVMQPFIGDCIPEKDLINLIDTAYSSFNHSATAPLIQTGHNEWVLELFHGPTLAFKDFALQFLGQLLNYVLKRKNKKVVIMGATSGDTGSAAIEGCRDCDNMKMFILHPHQRVSEVQRRQMTTVLSGRVFNIALKGNFDDCQNMVKACFSNQSFLPNKLQLVAVNSINWARIMAQIVYYFWAALHLGVRSNFISFSVPTGNFGDVFAGYIASKMGLPIKQLVVATNSNDILHRCLSDNDHSIRPLKQTLAPSMDIMISSNFERLLFDVHGRDGACVVKLMEESQKGTLKLADEVRLVIQQLFTTYRCDNHEMLEMIRILNKNNGYLLDPHSAIGLSAARRCRADIETPMVSLATAHPAKFPDAVKQAGFAKAASLPDHLNDLFLRAEHMHILENNQVAVQKFMADRVSDLVEI